MFYFVTYFLRFDSTDFELLVLVILAGGPVKEEESPEPEPPEPFEWKDE
jgi:hypothetical protein